VSRDGSDVATRLAEVRARIRSAGRSPDEVRIVAVTKGFGVEVVEEALAAGVRDLGENYAQELLAKAHEASHGARWHYLGSPQHNKIRSLAAVVSAWHGVDRPRSLTAIAESSPNAEVFVQVNVARVPGRPGCDPDDVDSLVELAASSSVALSGLMAVAPVGSPDEARRCFRWLARRAEALGLSELSMGMSDDFEIAVQEGATVLRLGRILFGERPSRQAARSYT
jgi:pyridoxal phosphate enzyme (YggS family)